MKATEHPFAAKDEQGRLQAIYDGTADVGRLRLNVNARFGEYDSARGGYYLDAFMPGSVFDVDEMDDSHIRLNFVRPDAADIDTGIFCCQRKCLLNTKHIT